MFIKRLAILCCLGYCAIAQAGSGGGQIVSFTPVVSNGTEFVVFVVQDMNSDKASCNTDVRFTLSAADPKYKSVLAAMMGSYFSGTSIFVRGKGTCTTYAGNEDVSYVCFNGGVPC